MRHARSFRQRWTVAAVAAALALAGAGVAAVGPTSAAASVSALAPTAGCGTAPTLNSGTHSISSGGQNRTFILRLPNNYDRNHPYRLVFGFHWLGSNANEVANGGWTQPYYGLQALANESAIFVAPQGLNAGWANSGGQDVTFVDAMIQRIESALCVDTTQRFSLGFSYGGGMSYALACARASTFRAVAIYGAGVISGCSGGNQPIAYLHAHGINDSVLSISGGRAMRDRFVGNNGCTPANPPEPASGSGTHTSFHYSGCSAGYPVAWYAFDGDHTAVPTDGNGTQWLPGETWSFFTQFQSTPPTTTSPPPVTTSPPPVTTSPPPVTTSPPPAGACSASVSINQWPGGFVATIQVTAGTSTVNGWRVTAALPSGASVTNTWNASSNGSSGTVQFTNVSYNGTIGAGQSTEFGFQGTGTGTGMTATCTTT